MKTPDEVFGGPPVSGRQGSAAESLSRKAGSTSSSAALPEVSMGAADLRALKGNSGRGMGRGVKLGRGESPRNVGYDAGREQDSARLKKAASTSG